MTREQILMWLEDYWSRSINWFDDRPSDEMLRECQANGIDPLEILRSYENEVTWYGINEPCVPWTDVP